MKCVVMWLNMCCFPIERHQLGFGQSRWALTPVNLRALWLTWMSTYSCSLQYQLSYKARMVSVGWVGSEWLDSECKNAHFQAFPQSTPSERFLCCPFLESWHEHWPKMSNVECTSPVHSFSPLILMHSISKTAVQTQYFEVLELTITYTSLRWYCKGTGFPESISILTLYFKLTIPRVDHSHRDSWTSIPHCNWTSMKRQKAGLADTHNASL